MPARNFCIPGVLIQSVLVEDHKVSKQILLYMRNIIFLSLPAHPVLPRFKEDCEGQAGLSPLSPSACSLCFPFVPVWLIVAFSPRWKSASPWQTPGHPGAVAGWCCPGQRVNSHCRGGAGQPLPLESAKEVRCGMQMIVAAHAFFITLAFCLENIHPTRKVFQT